MTTATTDTEPFTIPGVTGDAPSVIQVGPYQLTPDGDTGWFVLYIEDNEDDSWWDYLLAEVPDFAQARIVSDAVLELDGQVRVCAEHWSAPSILDEQT